MKVQVYDTTIVISAHKDKIFILNRLHVLKEV
jgi:hypothetical protein